MQAKQTIGYSVFYSGLLTGSCIFFWNHLQDATLLPRLAFLSYWLLIFTPVWWPIFAKKEFSLEVPDLLFFAYVLFHFSSIIQAINKPEALYEAAKMFVVFITYLCIKKGLQQKVISEIFLLKTLLFICLLYLGYGCSQLYALLKVAAPEGDNLYAINGLSGHKNLFSGFLFMSSCLLALLGLREKGLWRWLVLVVVVLMVSMIIILQTRSVFLSLVISSVVVIVIWSYLQRKFDLPLLRRLIFPLSGIVFLVIAFLVFSGTFNSMLSRFNIQNYYSSASGIERITAWYKSGQMLQDHWLEGVGGRNWTLMYPSYSLKGMFRMQYLNMTFLQPHNDYLWIWCELGALGLLSFIGLFISFLSRIWRTVKSESDSNQKLALTFLLVLQIGFMVFSFFDFPKERIEHLVLLSLSWALISFRTTAKVKEFSVASKFLKPVLIIAIVTIGFTSYLVSVRMNGESYMRELLAAKDRGDSKSVLLIAQMMNSRFSNLTPAAVPKVWYEGVAAYNLGQYEHAYYCFKTAKEQAPYNSAVLNNLGGMQIFYKHYDEALKTFKETLRINDKNDDARFNVAYTLYQVHRYNEALDTLNTVWTNPQKKAEFEAIIIQARDSLLQRAK